MTKATAIDGMRGLSAQVVFLAHAIPFAFPDTTKAWFLHAIGHAAQIAVVTFFALSGFVIASTLRHRTLTGQFNVLDFAIRRVARIWPPYIVGLVLMLGVIVLEQSGFVIRRETANLPLDTSLASWARALGLFSYAGNDLVAALNNPVWSLRLEVRLYVIAALAAVCFVSRGAVRWLTGLLIAYLVYKMSRLAFGLPACAIFCAGSVAALFGERAAHLSLVGLGAAAAAATAIILWGHSIEHTALTGLMIAYGGLVAVGLSSLGKPLAADCGPIARQVCATGVYSYTLYIIHYPLLQALRAGLDFGAGVSWQEGLKLFGVVLLINGICCLVAKFAERTDFFTGLLAMALPNRIRAAFNFPLGPRSAFPQT